MSCTFVELLETHELKSLYIWDQGNTRKDAKYTQFRPTILHRENRIVLFRFAVELFALSLNSLPPTILITSIFIERSKEETL